MCWAMGGFWACVCWGLCDVLLGWCSCVGLPGDSSADESRSHHVRSGRDIHAGRLSVVREWGLGWCWFSNGGCRLITGGTGASP